MPDWKPAAWWRVQSSYAYLNMNLKTRPGSTDTSTVRSAEGSSPRHQIAVRSFLDLPGRMEFSQSWRYITALASQRIPAYETADARLAWRAVGPLELSVTAQNLLQPLHAEFGGAPGGPLGIKRSVFASLTWKAAAGRK